MNAHDLDRPACDLHGAGERESRARRIGLDAPDGKLAPRDDGKPAADRELPRPSSRHRIATPRMPLRELHQLDRLDGVALRLQWIEHTLTRVRAPCLGHDHDVGVEARDDLRHVERTPARRAEPSDPPMRVVRGDGELRVLDAFHATGAALRRRESKPTSAAWPARVWPRRRRALAHRRRPPTVSASMTVRPPELRPWPQP